MYPNRTTISPPPKITFDRLQFAAVAGLMFLGAAFVFSATLANDTGWTAAWYQQAWVRQIFWYALGLGAAVAVCVVDYHTLARWSFVVYWATIICLVAVLIDRKSVV